MKDQELFELLVSEANRPFSGWDFSHITATSRMVAAPLVPDFSVEKYFDKLVEIHNTTQTQNYIDFHTHRFLIVAQKL